MKVLAFSRDTGGTNGMLPVVRKLKEYGCQVRYLAGGLAPAIIDRFGESFERIEKVQTAFSGEIPDLFITAMDSTSPNIGRDLIPLMRAAGVKTAALEDFWGSTYLGSWQEAIYHPDILCVNDRVGKDIVRNCWPDFNADHILVTGYPAMDCYAGIDLEAAKNSAREKMGIDPKERVLVYAGQIWKSGLVLRKLVESLNFLNEPVVLVARIHPRMAKEAPEELSAWVDALALFKTGRIVESSGISAPDCVNAADIVASMYSTMAIEAAVSRKAVISILYPEDGMNIFFWENGRAMNEFPLVSLGCAEKVACQSELIAVLKSAFHGGLLHLKTCQEKYFSLDGRNAERVARSVMAL